MTNNDDSGLTADLQTLDREWRSIISSPAEPRSTMNVIEYGLGEQRRAEVYVNRLMRYLLDPAEPHGMGTDFLYAFLQGLPATTEFDEDTLELSDVRVKEQVPIDDREDPDASTGYADLVLDIPNEWFLLVELKFSAKETGTEFYSRATHVDGVAVRDYGSGQYYLFLHQHDGPQASSDTFANQSWRTFVSEVLDDFLTENALRYPQRTTTQLHDLRDDLQSITNMTTHSAADQEKIALYLEHIDAIEDVQAAFDDAWESYATGWGRDVAQQLTDTEPEVNRLDGEYFPEVSVSRPDRDDERWILRANGGDWQHVFKYGWYRHETSLEKLADRAEDSNDLRIGFYHRMGRNRDLATRDHKLKFSFRNMGSNPAVFRDIYAEEFYDRRNEFEELLADTAGLVTGNKLTLIEATYDIPADSHEDYFDAYTAALHEAFVDLVCTERDLIQLMGATFERAVAKYQ
ncbi:PD-(D/E)XK nuclease family protein [Halorubrum yunnanense]|uniref:PD-(D/E)XK nuclease family protein n=1 Tax=Halorubrum yunnanense TaxID=1526162 RepID=A0ABD5YJU9_9EURY|nr:PD-(D/E)XK nuclease family protein [Halorubrum yunnanense]